MLLLVLVASLPHLRAREGEGEEREVEEGEEKEEVGVRSACDERLREAVRWLAKTRDAALGRGRS